MKQSNDTRRILICWQILSCSILVAIVSLTIWQIAKIKLPAIRDRELIFWLVEIN